MAQSKQQVGPTVPLPRLADCEVCKDEVKVRADGCLSKHDRPWGCDSPLYVDSDGFGILRCVGSEKEAGEILSPTFARWLHAQSKRRDDYDNVLTRLGHFQFRGCTQSPRRTVRDVEWTTAEELHGRLHLTHLARTGSDRRGGPEGGPCDWMCRYVLQASEVYDQLVAEAEAKA